MFKLNLNPIKNFRYLTLVQGWKPGYLALGCQFQFRCVETQMSGFSFGLVSRLLKIGSSFGFSFAYAQLLFLGFSFGLSFIQESYLILNTDYSNALLLGVFVLLQRQVEAQMAE